MNRKRSLLCLAFLLVTSTACSETPPDVSTQSPKFNVDKERATVKEAVTSWESSTGITVTASAYKELEGEWLNLSVREPQAEFRPELASAYLYELRDLKSDEDKIRKAIQLDDMKAFSFTKYAQVSFVDRQIGFLRCISNPTGGSILINGRAMGATIKDFTLGIGTYQVQIEMPTAKCTKQVSIKANSVGIVSCP